MIRSHRWLSQALSPTRLFASTLDIEQSTTILLNTALLGDGRWSFLSGWQAWHGMPPEQMQNRFQSNLPPGSHTEPSLYFWKSGLMGFTLSLAEHIVFIFQKCFVFWCQRTLIPACFPDPSALTCYTRMGIKVHMQLMWVGQTPSFVHTIMKSGFCRAQRNAAHRDTVFPVHDKRIFLS
jgi:hypothetical protein